MNAVEAEQRSPGRRPWFTSWRSAIRLAWRDARKHKAGSLLIMAMIGLPVMIICAAAAVLATVDVTVREALPATVGNAQALIKTGYGVIEQGVDGYPITESEEPAPLVAGRQPGEPWTADQLAQVTGGQVGVSASAEALARWSTGSERAAVRIIGREVLSGSGLVRLVEGRLPDQPGQVLVTEDGVAAGMPRSGRIEINTGQRDTAAEIVGVVQATGPAFESIALVVGEEWRDPAKDASYLLVRDRPVTWSDVVAWNKLGLSVVSPTVIEKPPAGASVTGVPRSSANIALVVVLMLGLVLETALLAGPAFAVSAARRGRTLALVASNGADHDQIARYVMAQGVFLGAVATVLGAGLGTIAGWASVRGIGSVFDPSRTTTIGTPPLDTYGWAVAMIMVVAFIAAAVSALVPGLKIAGLDVAGALAGRVERGRPSRGFPIAGAVIMGTGALLMVLSMAYGGSFSSLVGIGAGGGLLIIGALFIIPMIIERLGGLSSATPVAIRMGVRDASRSRSRTAPAVAAITVVVAVLTMISISSLSDDEQSRRDYLPSTLPGAAIVNSDGAVQATLGEIRARHPTWTTEPAGWSWIDEADGTTRAVSAVPAGCTPAQAAAPLDDSQEPNHCQITSSEVGWQVSIVAANTINPAAALSSEQRAALDQGSLLVSDPELISDGHVLLAYVSHKAGSTESGMLLRTVKAPAMLITTEQYRALSFRNGSFGPSAAVISAAGADKLAMPWTTYRFEVVDPAGPISRADERAINDRVAVPLTVERGYQSISSWITVILFSIAVALVLVGSLISTALTQVEARGASTTLAALGATRGLRRRAAAAQAIMIALLGAVLGVALGIAPGLGLAAGLTTDADPGVLAPVFVIPYAELSLVIIGVPLLAAALATAMVRPDPVLTRRPT